MPKHPHAENMALYAQDALETDEPWERWEMSCERFTWSPLLSNPSWDEDISYRRKPRTITINGYEVPEPVQSMLDDGAVYYVPDLGEENLTWKTHWDGSEYDKQCFDRGLIHPTKEAATVHAEALLSFTKKGD